MGKVNVAKLRYMSRDDFRVLTAVRSTSRLSIPVASSSGSSKVADWKLSMRLWSVGCGRVCNLGKGVQGLTFTKFLRGGGRFLFLKIAKPFLPLLVLLQRLSRLCCLGNSSDPWPPN